MTGAIAFATDFAIVIVAATLLAALARRLRQPTIVAYILTGLIVGPVFLGIVTEDQLIEVLAELGLGFLLFVLGIEMRLDRIREILRPVINIAVGQTILQTALAFLIALALGFAWNEVIVIALATVFGATPVIVKVLADKDELDSLPGRIDIGVLIVQDIYLVIILALVAAGVPEGIGDALSTVGRVLALMVLIGVAAYLSYRFLLPPLLHGTTRDHEALFVAAVAWAFLFIYVAESFQLTVEVGAFLAGLSIAQLPYSTEIKERIRPVTDFFLVIFFASIGLQLELDQLLAHWELALIAAAVLMVGNFLIMLYLIDREGFSNETSFLGSINMVQVSEFSLVVGTLAVGQEMIGEDVLGFLALMAVVTMSISTYIILFNQRLYGPAEPYIRRLLREGEDVDLEGHSDHALIVGYRSFADPVVDTLHETFGEVVVVDRNVRQLEMLAEEGEVSTIYGDVTHSDVRDEAGVEDAAFVLCTEVAPSLNQQLLDETDDDAIFFGATQTAKGARTLYEAGASYVVIRDLLAAEALTDLVDSSLETGVDFVDRLSEPLSKLGRAELTHETASAADKGGED